VAAGCNAAQRMLTIANMRFMPAKFQFFMSSCRNTAK
jgi:hypothetical protein